jgi:HEPN domain-containing protein
LKRKAYKPLSNGGFGGKMSQEMRQLIEEKIQVMNKMFTCEVTQEDYEELMNCLKEIYNKLERLWNTVHNIIGRYNDAHFIKVYLKACLDVTSQESSQCNQDLLALLNSLEDMLENPPDDVLEYFNKVVTKIETAMILTANLMGGLKRK